MEAIDLVGQRFSKLVVVGKLKRTPSGAVWECLCDCGERIAKYTTQLRRGGSTGCRKCERLSRSESATAHGGCKFGKSKLYMVWKGMRSRCRDRGNTSFPYYGGKGIGVNSEWAEFEKFREWAMANGYIEGLHLDRVDPGADYSHDNCEFVTAAENQRRRVAHHKRQGQ